MIISVYEKETTELFFSIIYDKHFPTNSLSHSFKTSPFLESSLINRINVGSCIWKDSQPCILKISVNMDRLFQPQLQFRSTKIYCNQ